MSNELALVLYYHTKNKFSFNALIGALETREEFMDLNIFFIPTKEELTQELDKIVLEYKKVVLGISFFTTQLWDIAGLIKSLKKKNLDNLILIAGGPHPTGDPGRTLNLGFDVVVVGEGEETFIELMLEIKKGRSFQDVKGLGLLSENGNYFFTGKRDPIDLNDYLPFPIKNTKFGAVEITRGCPYACYFCQTAQISGTRPRHRSIESICKTIRFMKNEKLTDIRFITPNAFSYGSPDGKSIDLSKLEELLKRIKEIIAPEGRMFFATFPSEVRPEHVNEDTIRLVKEYAYNNNITIGAQSGSQKVLDSCNRNHTVEDIYNAVEITTKADLKANIDFIFGLPGEEDEDILLTIDLMRNLTKMGARINAHSFMPLPMTAFSKKPVGKINEKLQNTIKNLTSKGLAFGKWKNQERLAIKIAKYLKTGNLT